tara:strand:+ start:930 stop:1244 length:315 start_codon:yes stop_codon:yes gene_type:complete
MAKKPETVTRLFVQLHSTMTKKVCAAPLAAEWPTQVLKMVTEVRDSLDFTVGEGDPAVRHFLEVVGQVGFMSEFGLPLTRLARRSDVAYEPITGTLSLPEKGDS